MTYPPNNKEANMSILSKLKSVVIYVLGVVEVEKEDGTSYRRVEAISETGEDYSFPRFDGEIAPEVGTFVQVREGTGKSKIGDNGDHWTAYTLGKKNVTPFTVEVVNAVALEDEVATGVSPFTGEIEHRQKLVLSNGFVTDIKISNPDNPIPTYVDGDEEKENTLNIRMLEFETEELEIKPYRKVLPKEFPAKYIRVIEPEDMGTEEEMEEALKDFNLSL
jgi:hypothetical protein